MLRRAGAGSEQASSELLRVVYEELRAMADRAFGKGPSGVTLQPTALAHDAYLKLVNRSDEWTDRQHFFAVASLAMRDILRDNARARSAQKRGGQWDRISLTGVKDTPESGESDVDLVDLDSALTKLSSLSQRQGRIVELRYLTGLPVTEVAEILGISVATVVNEWRFARAFLSRELSQSM